jgi:predicted transcriptional regulator
LPSSVLYTRSMTNAPELLSRLREVGRCMELELPSAAQEVRIACRALAETTEAESAEIAAAGLGLAEAAAGGGPAGTEKPAPRM